MPLADDTTLTGLVRRRWPIAEPQDAMLDSNDTPPEPCWPSVEMRLLSTPGPYLRGQAQAVPYFLSKPARP